EDESLVPCLLPEDRPQSLDKYWIPFDAECVQIGRVWKFDFLPLPFFSQLMVRLLHFTDSKIHWKYGIIAEKNDATCFVEVNHTDGLLSVLVRAKHGNDSDI